jgi:uncharacterized protein YbjT (DUF2867 family)
MYAITGITGQIGGMIGRILLDVRRPVRAVLRDAGKARAWKDRGCELALATIEGYGFPHRSVPRGGMCFCPRAAKL